MLMVQAHAATTPFIIVTRARGQVRERIHDDFGQQWKLIATCKGLWRLVTWGKCRALD